jgi:hypothetical protein
MTNTTQFMSYLYARVTVYKPTAAHVFNLSQRDPLSAFLYCPLDRPNWT